MTPASLWSFNVTNSRATGESKSAPKPDPKSASEPDTPPDQEQGGVADGDLPPEDESVLASETCSVVGCGKRPVEHGMCAKHHDRWLRYSRIPSSADERPKTPLSRPKRSVGDTKRKTEPAPTRKPPRASTKRCSIDGCDGSARLHGLCRLHYAESVRNRRDKRRAKLAAENDSATKPAEVRDSDEPKTGCLVFGCREPALDGGHWCAKHAG